MIKRAFHTHLLRRVVEIAQGVQSVADLTPQLVNFLVLLLQLGIPWINDFATACSGLRCGKLVLIYLGE